MSFWAFLVLAFIAGGAACYGILHQLAKVRSQVTGAAKEGAKEARFQE